MYRDIFKIRCNCEDQSCVNTSKFIKRYSAKGCIFNSLLSAWKIIACQTKTLCYNNFVQLYYLKYWKLLYKIEYTKNSINLFPKDFNIILNFWYAIRFIIFLFLHNTTGITQIQISKQNVDRVIMGVSF